MKSILEKIPSFLKNFYVLSTLFFLSWLCFVDHNDLFLQARLSSQKSELLESRQFYKDKILEIKNDQAALIHNPDRLEKLAREKYLMKKESEDLYVLFTEK